jgi:hypothetical protein
VKKIKTLLALSLIVGCCSCGSDSDSFGYARVENLAAADRSLSVGEGTALAADFSFDRGSVADGDRVFLIVQLPPGFEYRDGTSELETTSGDKKIGPQLTTCDATGESYLLYDMDRFDLENTLAPSRNAEARLKFTIDAVQRVDVGVVRAYADSDRPIFGCGQDFITDEEVAIEVD